MADQLRWWKLWTTALDDPDLANLSMEDCWRWAALGVLLRAHGEGGTATWRRPGHALAKAWRTTWRRLPKIARRLPGVEVTDTADTITIRMRNWHKYQEDSSAQRTRAWRERRRNGDGWPTVTRDGQPSSRETEQTRRDETVPPLVPVTSAVSARPTNGTGHGVDPVWGPLNARGFPVAAYHRDCPDQTWSGLCVDATFPGPKPLHPRHCPAHQPSSPAENGDSPW
jgi:hypothetical protein